MKHAYHVSFLLAVVSEHEEKNNKYGEDYSDPACGGMNMIDSEILMWVSCRMEDSIMEKSFNSARAQTAWRNLEEYLNL